MELSEDLALAMAIAIAEEDGSESDDFQQTRRRREHRSGVLQRGSALPPPKRQKTQKQKKQRTCNATDPAPRAPANTKGKGRKNGCPGTKTEPLLKSSRKPFTDLDANKGADDEKVNRTHRGFVSFGSADMVTTEAFTHLTRPIVYRHSYEVADIENSSDEVYRVKALDDEWSSMMSKDSGTDKLMQYQIEEVRKGELPSLGGEYPPCRDDQINSMEKNSPVWKQTEDVVSLAEEEELKTQGEGLQVIQNTESQIDEGAGQRKQLKQDLGLNVITSGPLQMYEVLTEEEPATQKIKLDKTNSEAGSDVISPIIIHPESQLHTLLQLCADTLSDGEHIGPGEEGLDSCLIKLDDSAKAADSIKVEEATAAAMTQNDCSSFSDTELASKMDYLKGSIPDLNSNKIFQAVRNSFFEVEIEKQDPNAVPTDFLAYDISNQSEPFVKCPICQKCITDMSFDQRELHTNACLDNSDNTASSFDENINRNAVISTNDKVEAQENSETGECVQLESSSHIAPVVRFLDTLNLSRYASAFIREEVDWDTFRGLNDEDLCTLGVTAFGPRRKILQSLQQLEQGLIVSNSIDTKMQQDGINEQLAANGSGRKYITDFFIVPPNQKKDLSRTTGLESSGAVKARVPSSIPARKRSISTHLGSTPEWMCIPGTNFRVDAFQHLSGDCTHWFLTHFHTDHYQGLTRTFRYGHVYTSAITAQIVSSRIGIPWERLKPLPLNEAIDIDGVKVTLLDANHCPGSVMFLFEPRNGKAVLHTGDFRFCEEMARNVVLQNSRIHTVMLDTTYCNPQYDFPNQETVIQFIIDAIQAEAFNPRTLFLIGTYTIGKERIFFEVAKALQKKIYVNATKLRLLQCMGFSDEDMKWLTTNENDAHIHVVPLWSIASFKRMKYLARQHHGRYTSIVSFSPTGWSFGRGKKRTPGKRWQQGTIIRYEAPYSEHCSFNELREFVRFINPINIVPSVHNDSAEAADALVALLLTEEAE